MKKTEYKPKINIYYDVNGTLFGDKRETSKIGTLEVHKVLREGTTYKEIRFTSAWNITSLNIEQINYILNEAKKVKKQLNEMNLE